MDVSLLELRVGRKSEITYIYYIEEISERKKVAEIG